MVLGGEVPLLSRVGAAQPAPLPALCGPHLQNWSWFTKTGLLAVSPSLSCYSCRASWKRTWPGKGRHRA